MRLFVAIDLSAPIKQSIALLRGSMPNVQWVPIQNYHLTLRFAGEITNRHLLEDMDSALNTLHWKPFPLSLSGVGILEGDVSDKLIINIERSDALLSLQNKLETLFRKAGYPPIKNRFYPHISIGYTAPSLREETAHWIQRHNLFRSPPMDVDHITLFESVKSGGDSVYIPQARYAWDPNFILPTEDE
ncbi:RNA 2',3'-cyclic phosphodiesterase [Swingsia samuiensis]|uniref:RNA 2',3'-cyclic phosphodiesterase n=1 Tax=Swingsia samuiensis TaxID=1293412 RepID=A0A4Y6UKI8_9PROT|nr:RNA 2',3'-cyclic phosphodiesterase [Swingsia samuiensis]QDH17594.1 RNA 2',3'-cyclic phosphodiesterase [Swingsia samuiensis]